MNAGEIELVRDIAKGIAFCFVMWVIMRSS